MRLLKPGTGRFLNRNPINEAGSILLREKELLDCEIEFDKDEESNFYAFVNKDAINSFDYLGLQKRHPPSPFREWQCPRRQSRIQKFGYEMEEPDGCSIPQFLADLIGIDPHEPYEGVSFRAACDAHDVLL